MGTVAVGTAWTQVQHPKGQRSAPGTRTLPLCPWLPGHHARTTKTPPAAPDHSPFGLWKLQPGGVGPNPLTCPQHKPTASSSRHAARRPNLCRHHRMHRAGTGEGGPSLHPPRHLSIPHPPPPAESPVSNPRQVPSAGPGGRGAFLRAGPGAAAAGQSPSPRRGQLVLTLPVRCWEKEPGGNKKYNKASVPPAVIGARGGFNAAGTIMGPAGGARARRN